MTGREKYATFQEVIPLEIDFFPTSKGSDIAMARLEITLCLPVDVIKNAGTKFARQIILEQFDESIKKGREDLERAKLKIKSTPIIP